jgi:hypothetical protein
MDQPVAVPPVAVPPVAVSRAGDLPAEDTLVALQRAFRATSTTSMPIAGMIVWGGLGVASLFVSPSVAGQMALFIMVAILPIAALIERARGRNFFAGGQANPLNRLFFISVVGIAVTVPLVLTAADMAREPTLIVLGMAILAGLIWIPYGWAADDPVGLQHAVGRAAGCYAAYALAPDALRAAAISAVVVLAYLYSLARMRRAGT